MNKYVLWAQNESTAKDPTIIIDGVEILDPDLRQYAFGVLSNKNEKLNITPELRTKILKDQVDLYKRLSKKNNALFNSKELTMGVNYARDNDGYYFQGSYINTDERGRLMPYMFYCKSSSVSEAISILKEASERLERECNSFELAFIEFAINRKFKHSKKKEFLAVVIISLILIIVLTIVFI